MNPILKGLRGTVVAVAVAALVQSVGSMALGPLADASNSAMSATTAVNIRSAASTGSARVGILYRGQRVQTISSSSGWTAVTHNGRTAYVATAYLTNGSTTSGNPSSSPSSGSVFTTAALNLRTGPSASSTVARIATKGEKLGLTGKISGAYSQVTSSAGALWAATAYLSSAAGAPTQSLPAVTGRVKATAALMIRTTADHNFASLGDVARGTILDVTGVVQNSMTQVIWKGSVRWVNSAYVTSISGSTSAPAIPSPPKTTTQYATTTLNIWKASSGSASLGEIPRGTAVAVVGNVTGGRAEIVHNGALRWVTARYLSATAPGASGGSDGNSGENLDKGGSSGLNKTNASTKKIVRHIWANYPAIKTMYGWRRDVTPDHPAGRAVDVMIPNYRSNKALGQEIANYYRANASEFNISYIIFNQQIWSTERSREGWRNMSSRGNDTANHKDHVHINTNR